MPARSPVRLWILGADGLAAAPSSGGDSLDAVSLGLPAGIYTTMRTYGGDRVVGLAAHLDRFGHSFDVLGTVHRLDSAGLRRAIGEAIRLAGFAETRLRLTVPIEGEKVFLACERFDGYPDGFYRDGVCCVTTSLPRPTPLAKTTAFIQPSRAARAQLPPGIHEAIRIDSAGQLLEGLSSNAFVVLGGVLRTASEGVLEGVTRGIVLAAATDLLPVELRPARLADLPAASEAFITSSTREVVPVVAIDGRRIGHGRPGAVTGALLARYRDHLAHAAERP